STSFVCCDLQSRDGTARPENRCERLLVLPVWPCTGQASCRAFLTPTKSRTSHRQHHAIVMLVWRKQPCPCASLTHVIPAGITQVMRALLLTCVAALGSGATIAHAQMEVVGAPTQGQSTWMPAAQSLGVANDNNNAQAAMRPGVLANPTPGSI